MPTDKQAKFNVLYLDDEDANLRIFKINFKRYYNVFTALTIQEALSVLAHNDIHLLISDQKMPEMTGTEFLKKILPLYPNTIRIILTGFSDIQDIIQAVNESKIHQYITKPYENGELKNVIDKALESYQLQNEKEGLLAELKKLNEELEAKVEERTKQLLIINEELLHSIDQVTEQTKKVEDSNLRMRDSIQYAKKIQQSVIPTEEELRTYFKDAWVWLQAKDVVGGDFYAFFDKGDKYILAVADCTGHGVPGALMSMLGDSLLRSVIDHIEEHSPEKILNFIRDGINKTLKQENGENKDGMEIAIVTIYPQERRLDFASSRRDMIYFQNGEMFELKAEKNAIGGMYDVSHSFSKQSISLSDETTFYLFSDGFQDQFGGQLNRRISNKKFKELLQEIQILPMQEQKEYLQNFFDNWLYKGVYDNTQLDDVMILGLKF
ncbi:MAG: response regulator [Thermonemataceae bacterium]|nr:response regulator [Thermonemataceae bacterium]